MSFLFGKKHFLARVAAVCIICGLFDRLICPLCGCCDRDCTCGSNNGPGADANGDDDNSFDDDNN